MTARVMGRDAFPAFRCQAVQNPQFSRINGTAGKLPAGSAGPEPVERENYLPVRMAVNGPQKPVQPHLGSEAPNKPPKPDTAPESL